MLQWSSSLVAFLKGWLDVLDLIYELVDVRLLFFRRPEGVSVVLGLEARRSMDRPGWE